MALLLWLMWSYLGGKGWPAQHFRSATTLPAGQQKIRADVPVGMGRGCSVGSCAGRILDCAVPIGQDATQRALGCVELSPDDCGTHDSDGLAGCAFNGGGGVSRIFPGRPRTEFRGPVAVDGLILRVCACALTLRDSCGPSFLCTFLWVSRSGRRRTSPTRSLPAIPVHMIGDS